MNHFVKPLLLGLLGLLLTACTRAPAPTRAQLLRLPQPSPTSFPDARPTTPPAAPALAATTAPIATSTFPASPAPSPTQTAPPTATPEPQSILRRLTGGGCCTQPFWSVDSRSVLFIDRPASRAVGVYGVDVERPGPPTLVTEQIYPTSGNDRFYVYPDGDVTVVQRIDTGDQYIIRNGGRPVNVSPDSQRILWQVTDTQGNFDQRRSETWIADLDGENPRVVARTVGLGDSQWLDSQRILLMSLPQQNTPFVSIGALTLGGDDRDDQLVELAQVSRPHEPLPSPAGHWLVFYLTFQADSFNDGLWVVPTDGAAPPRKLDFFGSYRWRDDTHLLYVPLEPGAETHTLWEYDVLLDTSRRLTDPAITPFEIANNDWAVSPDGRYVVFVSALDHDLWLMDLER